MCNMAIDLLGNYGTINNIDTPVTNQEKIFALWYDVVRQFVLKLMMPNFALGRATTSQMSTLPAFGYSYNYAYPSKALKLLGIGEVKEKFNNYGVETDENDVLVVMVNELYPDGMPVRFIKDVTDVNRFTPEFKMTFAMYLAAYVALPLTQDVEKQQAFMKELPAQLSIASSVNGQENMPVRISRSRYREARRINRPELADKL